MNLKKKRIFSITPFIIPYFFFYIQSLFQIKLVSDLTSGGIIAFLHCFIACRWCPSQDLSDYGTTFVGTHQELCEAHQLLQQKEFQDKVLHYTSELKINWSLSSCVPHFGGLWDTSSYMLSCLKLMLCSTADFSSSSYLWTPLNPTEFQRLHLLTFWSDALV